MSWGRALELRIGDLEIHSQGGDDIRVAFDVVRSKSRDPNSATVQVWNLAPSTRAQWEQEKPRVFCELSAGYLDEGIGRLFSGVLYDVVTDRERGDWVTTFSLGDDATQKAALSRVNRAFPAGTPVGDVLRDLIKATGLGSGNLLELSRVAKLAGVGKTPRAWTASGSALQALQAFTRSIGFNYTIQNQDVIFIGIEPSPDNGILITGENATRPTKEEEGAISFVCRLVPDLIPGTPLRLQMQSIEGDFVAIETAHSGDTHGRDYSVRVLADPFDKVKTKGLRVNA